jgi:copper homeostasis protein
METIIQMGCERILNSGQHPTAEEGVEMIDQLVREADDRIVIMPGSGIRSANIVQLAEKTGASEFHTSARVLRASATTYVNVLMKEAQDWVMASDAEIKKIKDKLISIS